MSQARAIEIAPPVTMTEAARRYVEGQIARRGSGVGVRLGIKKMGCSGFGYELEFIDEARPDDEVYPLSDSVAIYVDPQTLPLVKGTQIDFVRKGLNATFEFNNPNVKDTCGCGESFNV